MKSKKVILILLPLVIGLWGTIIYKVVAHLNPSTDHVVESALPRLVEETVEVKDTMVLQLDYPDPFMKRVNRRTVKKKSVPVKKSKQKPVSKKPAKKIAKPNFKWLGKIANRENQSSRYLLTVNGSDQIVSVGDSLAGFYFRKAFEDSLEFRKNREVIFVKK